MAMDADIPAPSWLRPLVSGCCCGLACLPPAAARHVTRGMVATGALGRDWLKGLVHSCSLLRPCAEPAASMVKSSACKPAKNATTQRLPPLQTLAVQKREGDCKLY